MGDEESLELFPHVPLPRAELDSRVLATDMPGFRAGRWYKTPNAQLLPSVTTRLKWFYGEAWKQEWIRRVGQEQADLRTGQGLRRGSALHLLAERYVSGHARWDQDAMPINLEMFCRVKPYLDHHLSNVYGIEYPLWSDTLKTAGRADLIARYKGLDTVLDYKTCRYPREVEQIESYFIQATVYALMTTERTGLNIPRIVVFLIPEHDNKIICHEAWIGEWENKAREIFSREYGSEVTH